MMVNFMVNYFTENGINPFKQEGNLIVKIKGNNPDFALIFNGHMDTVSPGNLNRWKTDPFKSTLIGNKLFGLGTSDMKSGLAAMMVVAKELLLNPPPIDVWFAFVTKEELDGSGSKKFVDWFVKNTKYKKVGAIIGDTTGNNKLEIGHKGNAFIKVKFNGQSGHGSRPDKIHVQAIVEANIFVSSIGNQVKIWQEKYEDKYLGVPSIAMTGISSGEMSSPNKIPGECVVQLDIRTTPALHQKLIKELNNWLSHYEFVAEPASFGWCDSNEDIVKVVLEAAPKTKLTCSMGATDQCFFTLAGIPAVIFGPGEKTVVHQENEWVDINEVENFKDVYKRIVYLFGSNL